MVLVGFENNINSEKALNYLQANGLTIFDEHAFADNMFQNGIKPVEEMRFFEVETENLEKNGLCCWGEIFTINANKRISLKASNPRFIQKHLRVVRLFEEDIAYWLDFTNKFVSEFGKVALFRYYSEVEILINIEELKLKELTRDKLLNMDNNHIFVVS